MDTDDLSNETYKAVLLTAEKFHHNLTLQFGVLASNCLNDNDYLLKASKLITSWQINLSNSIANIFFDVVPPTPMVFEKVLIKIQQNIETVQNILIEKRSFDEY